MDSDTRARTHALFGLRAPAEATVGSGSDGSRAASEVAGDNRTATWLACAVCGGREFTVTLSVALDVARPFAHGGRAFAADDYETVVSVNDLAGAVQGEPRWTCTGCGATTVGPDLAPREPFDPLVELFDTEPGERAPMVCDRCGQGDLELRRLTVERVPVVLFPSADGCPAVVEGPRPLGTEIVDTVTWCRTCARPVDGLARAS